MSLRAAADRLIYRKEEEQSPDLGAIYTHWAKERYDTYTVDENQQAVENGFYWIPYYPLDKSEVDSLIVAQAKINRNLVRRESYWAPYPPLSAEAVDALVERQERYDAWRRKEDQQQEVTCSTEDQVETASDIGDPTPLSVIDDLERKYRYLLTEYFDAKECDKQVFEELFIIATNNIGISHDQLRSNLVCLFPGHDQRASFRGACRAIFEYTTYIRRHDNNTSSEKRTFPAEWWLENVVQKLYDFMVVPHNITTSPELNKQCAKLQVLIVRHFRQSSDREIFSVMLVAALKLCGIRDFTGILAVQGIEEEGTPKQQAEAVIANIVDGIRHVRTGTSLSEASNEPFKWWMLTYFPKIQSNIIF